MSFENINNQYQRTSSAMTNENITRSSSIQTVIENRQNRISSGRLSVVAGSTLGVSRVPPIHSRVFVPNSSLEDKTHHLSLNLTSPDPRDTPLEQTCQTPNPNISIDIDSTTSQLNLTDPLRNNSSNLSQTGSNFHRDILWVQLTLKFIGR